MRWFKLNDRTYNLEHIKAFEVEAAMDEKIHLLGIYSFQREAKGNKWVRLGIFDSVEDAENCIAAILNGAHDVTLAHSSNNDCN